MIDSSADEQAVVLRLRLAVEEDIPGIQLVAAESWRAAYAGVHAADFIETVVGRTYSATSLRRVLHSTRSAFFVACEDDDVIGFSHAGSGPQCAELYRILVRPAWRATQAADLLLRRSEEWLQEEGYAGYGCYVQSDNAPGLHFYESRHFRRVPALNQGNNLFLWRDLP